MKSHIAIAVLIAVLVQPGWLAAGICFQSEKEASPPTQENQTRQEDAVDDTLFGQVQSAVVEGEIRQAVAMIETSLEGNEEEIDVDDVQRSYQLVIAAFARTHNNREAFKQLNRLFEFQIERIESDRVQNRIANTVRSISNIAARINKTDQSMDVVERALGSFQPLIDYEKASTALVQFTDIRAIKAQELLRKNQREDAETICESEYDQLKQLYEANAGEAIVSAMYTRAVSNLMRVTTNHDKRDALYSEHQGILSDKIDSHPENMSFAVQYLTAVTFRINYLLEDEESQTALDLTTEAEDLLKLVIDTNPEAARALQPYGVGIARMRARAESQVTVSKLMNQPAPEIDAKSWVNGEPVDPAELEGKVLLLDFWAVWCGPCIRTFPHLIHLHDTYAKQGLQIVGATRHYNFTWDDENDRPVRSESKVDADEENNAIQLFMESHKLPYPSIVMPDESAMSQEFGVTGIPHVVLIDRKGNVRLVNVGAGESGAKELEDKIKELLEEK